MIITGALRAAQLGALGYLNNPFVLWDDDIATVAATNGTETGGPESNVTDPSTAKYCYPSVSGGEYRLEFTTSGAIRCVGLAAHNLTGATVDLDYWDGAAWVTLSSHTPANNDAILWRFDAQNPAKWSINISSASEQPALGRLMAGTELVIPRRLYQGYAPPITPTIVQAASNVSDGGHYLGGAAFERGSSVNVGVGNIAPDFIRGASFKSFMTHFNRGNPFFWAWRPNKYGDAFYAWRSGSALVPQNTGPLDLMGFSMAMRLHHDP